MSNAFPPSSVSGDNPPARLPSSVGKAPNMIAVASGKGGVGKTWLSVTLTHALARMGRRTLLFDGDLGLANIDVQLGLMPKRDLGGFIEGKLLLEQAITPHEEYGFDVIAGRSGSGSLAMLPPQRLVNLGDELLKLARGYDRVILDLGAGIDRTVRTLSGWAATSLVVATPDPTSLTDAYAFIKLTTQADPKADIRVAINMVDSVSEGQRTYQTLLKACQGFLKMSPPLAGIIRRDRKVADAIRHQTSLLTRSPTCDAARDIEKLMENLLDTP
ncbi:MAG: MinD/ParA family protein [Alphaproteobacteria bacterium]|nr:MinD/ParA family protein [Alphaproteobacteria bacterium]MBU0797132.1 MinD/ParA family protein [Alphaproteobacteria bacterium]MBU0888119.1 MinD/ParA family protein [Alphaproteobacteria bacterium]MBU1811564.1 MinD/ParA family protein [Alphaproteobacteria bacterium]